MRETFHRTGTAHAQSYESYAYYFHLRDSQSQHAFLAGGTLGSFYYDGAARSSCRQARDEPDGRYVLPFSFA